MNALKQHKTFLFFPQIYLGLKKILIIYQFYWPNMHSKIREWSMNFDNSLMFIVAGYSATTDILTLFTHNFKIQENI